MRIFQIILLFLVFSTASLADAPTDLGPTVGSALPHDLTLADSTGTARSFDELKGKNGLVLVFYRSAKWCPYCQRQLMEVNRITETVTARGYSIAGVSYDEPMILDQFKMRRNIDFVLLSDTDSEAIDAFGIRNPEYGPDHFAHGVPYPMVAVYDAKGILKAKLYEASYKNRPANDAILDAIAAAEGTETSR